MKEPWSWPGDRSVRLAAADPVAFRTVSWTAPTPSAFREGEKRAGGPTSRPGDPMCEPGPW